MRLSKFFIAGLSLFLLASCTKETDITIDAPKEENLIKITVTATADELDSKTKTSLDSENGSLYWTYGDHISVFDGSANRDFESDVKQDADPTKTATFSGTIQSGASSFAAVYPYNASASYSEGLITSILPTSQIAIARSFANNSNVAVAGNPSEDKKEVEGAYAVIDFTFQNVGALVKFTLSQSIHQSVTIRAFTKDGDTKTFEKIAGEIKINPSTAVAETTENSSTAVALTAASGTLAAESYYAVILPIDTKYIQFEFSNGTSTKVRNTKTTISVSRSSYYDMGTIDEGITYPDPYVGDYIIVSKGSTGYWVVMSTSFTDGNNGRWQYVESTNACDKKVNLEDSSVDFRPWSNNTYKFSVEAKDGGYILKNSVSGNYITYKGSGNLGKEVGSGVISKFDVFTKNEYGIWTMGMNSGSDTYSLQYNVNNFFSFYSSSQAQLYLIPYVYAAPEHNLAVSSEVVTLSGVAGSTQVINVTSNYAWTAALNPGASKFIVTESGTGDGTITVTASADGESTEQTLGTFTVSDEERNVTVTVKQSAYVSTITDEITVAGFSNPTSTSYRSFSITSGTNSGANYAGTLASDNPASYLQLNNNATGRGLVSTVSGGRIYSITANWGGSNVNDRYITIYGKNTAYSSSNDLYEEETRGVEIGKITFSTGQSSATLDNIPESNMYSYVGFYASGAMYVTSFNVSWAQTLSAPEFNIPAGTYYAAQNVTISAGEGATIYYTTDGNDPTTSSDVYTSAIAVSSSTTIKAIAVKGGKSSAVSSATYTIEKPTQLDMSDVSCSSKTHNSLTFEWNEVTNATGYSVSLDGGDNWISNGTSRVYTWNGLNAEAEYTIYVKALGTTNGQYTDSEAKSANGTTNAAPTLMSIAVTTNPTKTIYTLGEAFSFDGAVVTATYSDSSQLDVTASCTTNGDSVVSTLGENKDVTVTYSEGVIEKQTTFKITVNAAVAVTYSLTISPNDFNTASYADNNNEKTSEAVCTADNTKKMEVKWTSYQVYKNSSAMQWQKNKGYIYNSTDLGTITSVTVNSSEGSFTTYYGTSEHPTSGTTVGNGFFTVKVGSDATGKTSSIVVVFEVTE